MKLKMLLLVFIATLFLGGISYSLLGTANAENGDYKISIIEKNYEIFRIREVNDQKWVYFNISITLHNSGGIVSDDITVKIEDEDGWYVRNDTLAAHESKTFIFEDHPLLGTGEHKIDISFYPTDKNVVLTEYNHGEDVLILMPEENNNFIPGFEAVLLGMAIVIYVLLIKYRK